MGPKNSRDIEFSVMQFLGCVYAHLCGDNFMV